MLGNIIYTPAPAIPLPTSLTIGTTPIVGGTAGAVLFESTLNKVSENAGLNYTAGGVLTITSITQQLKVAYNAGNRLDLTVGSTGSATITLTGTNPKFTFTQGAIIETLSIGLGGGGITSNTTIGFQSLSFSNTIGNNNTAVGYFAMRDNTTGNNNTAVGSTALQSNTGSNNTAMGYQALARSSGGGGQNVAIGSFAGAENSSYGNMSNADQCIFIGYSTRPIANGETNTIIIGTQVTGGGSNTVTLGNNNITKTFLKGSIAIGLLTAPSAKLHVISTTEQFRAGYDTTHFASFTCNSTGALTVTLTGTTKNTFFTDPVVLGGTITLAPYTFATLPAAPLAGQKAYIIDALAPVYLAPAVGGGLIFCPVFYNGVNWVTC